MATGVLMIVGSADGAELALFYVLLFSSSALMSIDMPTRQAIVPDLVGGQLTTAGIALNAAGGQIALPVAIIATGYVVDAFGPGVGYLVGSCGHIALVASLALMRHRTPRVSVAALGMRVALRDVWAGLVYTRREPVILWVVVLLIAMMGLGFPAVANLGPTWITTVVGVPVREFGLVAATWGLGALLASGLLARFSRYERKGLIVGVSAVGFGLSFLVFGGGHTVANAVIGNFGLGVAMVGAQVAGTALIQLIAAGGVSRARDERAQSQHGPGADRHAAAGGARAVDHARSAVPRARAGAAGRDGADPGHPPGGVAHSRVVFLRPPFVLLTPPGGRRSVQGVPQEAPS